MAISSQSLPTPERLLTVVPAGLTGLSDAVVGLAGASPTGAEFLVCGDCRIILHLPSGSPLPRRRPIWCQNCGALNRP